MRASLRALEAFVAVARTGSLAEAARTLNVSASAVSHLMADLEAQVGRALFAGRRRGTLNEAGRQLFASLDPAFAGIEGAVRQITRHRAEMRLSTLSTFAILWLIPRLPRLQARLPDTSLLVSTETRVVDLQREPFDAAIRWGHGHWPGLEATPLFRERLALVAHPSLLAGAEGEGLWRLPRLDARSRPDDWPGFLAEAGRVEQAVRPSATFETRALMLQAAIAGLGVAVMDLNLAAEALRAGHLARAATLAQDRPEGYFLVVRDERAQDGRIRALRQWLCAEVAASPA